MIKFRLQEWPHNLSHSTMGVLRLLSSFGKGGWWLAGGCVMSYVANKKHDTDYDVFFENENVFDALELYIQKTLGAHKLFNSLNAVTYLVGGQKIQLVKRKFYNSVQDVFNDFDFTISMFALDYEQNLYCGKRSLKDLADKKLIILHINALGETFKRLIKFGKRGYKIPTETYKKLIGLFSAYDQLNEEPEQNVFVEGRYGHDCYFNQQLLNGGITFVDKEEDEEPFEMKDDKKVIILKNPTVLKEANKGNSYYDE